MFESSLILFSSLLLLSDLLLLFAWLRKRTPTTRNRPPLTVIIAARNEAENLSRNLPSVLQQDYPDYEVLVVLNQTTDASLAVLEPFRQQFPKLYVFDCGEIPAGWSPKKFALHEALRRVATPWVVFTDADCLTPPGWLTSLADRMDDKAELVLGVGLYDRAPGLLNRFIRYETFRTAFQYISLANAGFPVMAVGRNLAARTTFIRQSNVYEIRKNRLSGDDDLLVNNHANPENVRTVTSPPVFSRSASTLKEWYLQKTRHFSASPAYSLLARFLLGGLNLLHAGFYLSLFSTVIFSTPGSWGVSMAAIRFMISGIAFHVTGQARDGRPGPAGWLLGDFLLLPYHLWVFPAGLLKKPEWTVRSTHDAQRNG